MSVLPRFFVFRKGRYSINEIRNEAIGIAKKICKCYIMRKTKQKFSAGRERYQINDLLESLPDKSMTYKINSSGGFSSIGFILYVAEKAVINELTVSTLRVGRKHLMILDTLYKQGRIRKINFVIGSLMKNDSKTVKKYGYYDDLETVCKENGWSVYVCNNHSKILLFDTDEGKYVIETSSNLNENNKIEQFSFEMDNDLYDFHYDFFMNYLNSIDS